MLLFAGGALLFWPASIELSYGFFLAALFGLPPVGWQAVVLVVVWQGAVEWARLSGLSGRAATAYWFVTLALMAGMLWFDNSFALEQQTMLHLVWYMLAVLFWVFAVPAWLMIGWRPQNAWLMGAVGWLVLLPTGLAMLDLRAFNPWLLLFAMTLVMAADISAYFVGKRFGKRKLAPASQRSALRLGWSARKSAPSAPTCMNRAQPCMTWL